MKPLFTLVGTIGLVATFAAAAPVGAQQSSNAVPRIDDAERTWAFDLSPALTKAEFREFTADVGSVLRFRPAGDSLPLEKGAVDVSVQFTNAPIDDSKAAWTNTMSHPAVEPHLGDFMASPRVVARFGVSDRVDIGAMGGFAPHANYGVAGVDSRIALLKQGPARPVSVSVRPSVAFLFAPSEVVVGTVGVDLSVSRAFGPFSPYAGVGAISSGAMEISRNVNLDPVDAGASLAYAGVAYRWRMLTLSAEVEKGALARYAFGIGTRF